jgi:hypothetical protein
LATVTTDYQFSTQVASTLVQDQTSPITDNSILLVDQTLSNGFYGTLIQDQYAIVSYFAALVVIGDTDIPTAISSFYHLSRDTSFPLSFRTVPTYPYPFVSRSREFWKIKTNEIEKQIFIDMMRVKLKKD